MRIRELVRGRGYLVKDCLCSAGPADRPFEEQTRGVMVAAVLSGSFRCRSGNQDVLLTPGSLFVRNAGEAFECSHELSTGDHCVSVHFEPDVAESAASALGAKSARLLNVAVPVQSATAAVVARAALLAEADPLVSAQELAHELLGSALSAQGVRPVKLKVTDLRRAHDAAAHLEQHAAEPIALEALAAQAQLSTFHFLRSFRAAFGTTPHQYLLGVRVRRAARSLLTTDRSVTDIAFDSGFGDLSNFIRTFRRATGRSPSALRGQRPAKNHRGGNASAARRASPVTTG